MARNNELIMTRERMGVYNSKKDYICFRFWLTTSFGHLHWEIGTNAMYRNKSVDNTASCSKVKFPKIIFYAFLNKLLLQDYMNTHQSNTNLF